MPLLTQEYGAEFLSAVGGVDPATSAGITVTNTLNAAANNWKEVTAAAPFTVGEVLIWLYVPAVQGRKFVLNVGVGAAGSEVIVASVFLKGTANAGYVHPVRLPVRAPKGARVSLSLQGDSTATSTTNKLVASLIPAGPRVRGGYHKNALLGVDLATTAPTATLVVPAVNHTKGAWTLIGALPFSPKALVASITTPAAGGSTTLTTSLVDIGFGPDTNNVTVAIPDVFMWVPSSSAWGPFYWGPFMVPPPSPTWNAYARMQTADVTQTLFPATVSVALSLFA